MGFGFRVRGTREGLGLGAVWQGCRSLTAACYFMGVSQRNRYVYTSKERTPLFPYVPVVEGDPVLMCGDVGLSWLAGSLDPKPSTLNLEP